MAGFHFGKKALKSKKVAEGVKKKAAAAQEYWKSIAPVFGDRPPHREAPGQGGPGAYRDSIVVKDMTEGDSPKARVVATDFKAKFIEFGNSHMPTYAPKAKVLAKFRK